LGRQSAPVVEVGFQPGSLRGKLRIEWADPKQQTGEEVVPAKVHIEIPMKFR
jgi:hypothetical protein